MPEKSKSSKDGFVSKVVADPANVPDTLLLSGWLGDSSMPGHTRLYFDPQLSSYVEIPDDAILHTQDQAPETSPLGGSFVWIKKDAVLTHKTTAAQAKAKFLEGPIAGQAAAAVPQPHAVSIPRVACQVTAVAEACHTQLVALCHPTIGPNCFTAVHILCPQTHTPACMVNTHTPHCVQLTHTPLCFVTHQPQCFITTTPACHTVVCPTLAACPSVQLCLTQATCPSVHICQSIPACPSVGACPSIACGFPGGGGVINPVQ